MEYFDGQKCGPHEVVERATWGYIPGHPYPMMPLEEITGDPNDKGFYGVHVGDPYDWISVLVEDYNRDENTVQIMEIACSGMYLIDDPNVIDKGSYPDSYVLVSDKPEIPADLINMVDVDKDLLFEQIKNINEEHEDY